MHEVVRCHLTKCHKGWAWSKTHQEYCSTSLFEFSQQEEHRSNWWHYWCSSPLNCPSNPCQWTSMHSTSALRILWHLFPSWHVKMSAGKKVYCETSQLTMSQIWLKSSICRQMQLIEGANYIWQQLTWFSLLHVKSICIWCSTANISLKKSNVTKQV